MVNLFWLLVIIAIAAMVAWYFINGGRTPTRSSEPGTRQPSLFNLQLGDIVQYQGIDWVVEDKLLYNDDGWEWIEYLLQDGDRIAFLAAEDDDTLEVTLSEPVKDCPVSNPPPAQITYQQKVYTQEESGTASLSRLRKPGRQETCKYYEYTGPAESVLSIEQWSGQTEVSIGESVRPYQLTFLPGDGESVYRSEPV